MRHYVATHHDVFAERLCLPAEHVRSALHEALILQQPGVPTRSLRIVRRLDGAVPVRDRVGWIRHVAVERGGRALERTIEGQPPRGAEVQVAGAAGAGWPRVAP